MLDDTIELGGVTFPVTGIIRHQVISEFEAGLKVGPAKYDNREHAFFHAFNDFSGGFGHRFLDIREEQGVFWDASGLSGFPIGADTRRPGHITLPPRIQEITTTGGATTDYDIDTRMPSHPFQRLDDGKWLGAYGSALYRSSDDLDAWTEVYEAGASSEIMSVIRTTAAESSTLGSTNAPYMLARTGGRYQKSANGIDWGNGAENKTLLDLIWWDNKILAVETNTIIFGVISSNVESFDAEVVVTVPTAIGVDGVSQLRFIGVAQGPTGENVVYFTDGREIYWLDFYARKYHLIDMGIPITAITGACIWEGNVCWSDGWEVWSYSASNSTLREIGLPKRTGIPSSMAQQKLFALIPGGQFLFALAWKETGGQIEGNHGTTLLCYNQAGWHIMGARQGGQGSAKAGFIAAPATPSSVASRELVVMADTSVFMWDIPRTGYTPNPGVDFFSAEGGWITGWMDGGFADLDGTLLRLDVDGIGLDSTHYLSVGYQLDNDEANGSWIKLVNSAGSVSDFTSTGQSLYFKAVHPGRGRKFRTVRFFFQLKNTGSNLTQTPIIKALTLVYIKQPVIRTQWSCTIDVNRMLEKPTEYQIDGANATVENIYAKLQDLWTNDHRLLKFVVPSIVPSGINVRLVEMPFSLDDFRNAVSGHGGLTVSVLEPIPSIADTSDALSDTSISVVS